MRIRFSDLTDLILRVVTCISYFLCILVSTYINIFFSNRVVDPWNSLPAEPHHFSSLSTFKTFLKGVDLSQFVQQ